VDYQKNSMAIKPQSAYEASPDGTLPIEYQNVLDALDVLAYVAANTNKIALGTYVKDMFFFTPIMLAKRFITFGCFVTGEGNIWPRSWVV
jgi:alkanesulfonate monooxygenase SsuD/methylene tetrahydromethanopterin reductase-like flavin-dependent oxidoreductase (luciferase family)